LAKAFERWDSDVGARALHALGEIFADESLYLWQRKETRSTRSTRRAS
jgi:hypothetical protein